MKNNFKKIQGSFNRSLSWQIKMGWE